MDTGEFFENVARRNYFEFFERGEAGKAPIFTPVRELTRGIRAKLGGPCLKQQHTMS